MPKIKKNYEEPHHSSFGDERWICFYFHYNCPDHTTICIDQNTICKNMLSICSVICSVLQDLFKIATRLHKVSLSTSTNIPPTNLNIGKAVYKNVFESCDTYFRGLTTDDPWGILLACFSLPYFFHVKLGLSISIKLELCLQYYYWLRFDSPYYNKPVSLLSVVSHHFSFNYHLTVYLKCRSGIHWPFLCPYLSNTKL